MEGKTVIFTVLLLSLVMAQIQVEAEICPSKSSRDCFNHCRGAGGPSGICVSVCQCSNVNGKSPKEYEKEILENTGAIKEEYCKLGCASSVCSAITTLQNSDAGEEVVNGAVEQCTKACSAFCTKGSVTALDETAQSEGAVI